MLNRRMLKSENESRFPANLDWLPGVVLYTHTHSDTRGASMNIGPHRTETKVADR